MTDGKFSPTPQKPYLHLGCGRQIWKEFLNVDCVPLPGVDAVVDLNKYPWPFDSGRWQKVFAHHLLEHLDDAVKPVAEIHRILAPGGIADIRVPHHSSWGAWADPTHRHYYCRKTFEYFRKSNHHEYYFNFSFSEIECANICREGNSLFKRFMNRLVETELYERLLWKYIPCSEIRVKFVR